MNYLGYYEFPFPAKLSAEEEELREFFLSLSDELQLKLLNASCSYDVFLGCVANYKITSKAV